MKFTVSLQDFQKVLQKVLPAIPRKSTLPILEHLHFSLTGDTLKIIATDQDITIMSLLNVSGSADGSILVPGHKIGAIGKVLDAVGTLEFNANIETKDINLITATGKYNMKGIAADEYLDIPELFESEKPNVEITDGLIKILIDKTHASFFKKSEIVRLASKTFIAVSNDEFRPAMNGVLFQFRESYINAVATDSFRLVKIVLKSEEKAFPKDLDIIVPTRTVDLLRKADDDVILSIIENRNRPTHVRIDVGDTVFITRLIDEKFPPYESVIPQNNEIKVLVTQKDLATAIQRVSIFTSENSNQIRMSIDKNSILLFGEDEETGSQGNETIDCDYKGKKFDVGFNYKYLLDAVQNIDTTADNPKLFLTFSEPTRPVLVKPNTEVEDLLMLIMPVRIS